MLVEEQVDLPGLVAHDEVVGLLVDEVGEHAEVVDQERVHPAERFEHVQVVLAGLAFQEGGFAGEVSHYGVDVLAAPCEEPGDGILGDEALDDAVEQGGVADLRAVPAAVDAGSASSALCRRARLCSPPGAPPQGSHATSTRTQHVAGVDGATLSTVEARTLEITGGGVEPSPRTHEELRAMIIQLVRYGSKLSTDEVQERFEDRADGYRQVPGLVQKYYVHYPETDEYGGIYLWESQGGDAPLARHRTSRGRSPRRTRSPPARRPSWPR